MGPAVGGSTALAPLCPDPRVAPISCATAARPGLAAGGGRTAPSRPLGSGTTRTVSSPPRRTSGGSLLVSRTIARVASRRVEDCHPSSQQNGEVYQLITQLLPPV